MNGILSWQHNSAKCLQRLTWPDIAYDIHTCNKYIKRSNKRKQNYSRGSFRKYRIHTNKNHSYEWRQYIFCLYIIIHLMHTHACTKHNQNARTRSYINRILIQFICYFVYMVLLVIISRRLIYNTKWLHVIYSRDSAHYIRSHSPLYIYM